MSEALRVDVANEPVPENLCSMCLKPHGERYSLVFPKDKRAAREIGVTARFGRCCWPKIVWSLDRAHYTVIEMREDRR